jgi:hypothetical protein
VQHQLSRALSTWINKARMAGLTDPDIESMLRAELRAASDEAIA